jgi:lysophospholipase L1-like esterase
MNRTGLYFTAGVVTTLSIILVNKWLFSSSKMNASISGRKKVLFFGDSITQHGFNPSEGWISSLAYWWSRRVDILNRGFSGYNTKWGLSMIDKVVIAEQPDLVFVFFGANDAVDVQVTQHVPLEMFKQNMRQIIDKIQKVSFYCLIPMH